MPNLTLTDNTNTPILPEFDSDTSSDKVQVAVTDKQSADALTARVNDLVQKVQQDGGTTNLSGVVSSDSERTVAEQIAAAIKTGKTITLEAAAAAPLDSSAVTDENQIFAEYLDEQSAVAQYLDLKLELKADGKVIGTISELSQPITYVISVPEKYIQDGIELFVMRLHEGKVNNLPLIHVKDNLYSFTTDRFSTYALAYREVKAEAGLENTSSGVKNEDSASSDQTNDAPPTGDSSAALYAFLMLTFCTAAAVMALVRTKVRN